MFKFSYSFYLGVALIAFQSGCSTAPGIKKVIVDESENKPSWVGNSKNIWEEDGHVYFKATQQVRGNERLNACYDLAKLNASEALITGVQQQIKGTLDSHEATLSENAEVLLNKSRSSEFSAKVSGLRFKESYFVRYSIGETERVDCFELGEITQSDYNSLKRSILEKVEAADPRIKEAIAQKHIDFFTTPKNDDSARVPAGK